MKNRQRAKYDMYLLLKAYLLGVAPAIFLLMPYFTGWFTNFQTKLTELIGYINKQEQHILGFAVYKANCRAILVDAITDLANALMIVATATDNPILFSAANYTETDLKRLSDAELIAAGTVVGNLANANLAALVDFGITALTMTAYFVKIDVFTAAKTQPKDEIFDKKGSTTAIAITIENIDAILEKMDRPVRLLRRTQRLFYTQYFDRRKMTEPATRLLAGKGKVTNVNGNPIAFVTMTCLEIELDRRTGKKGGFVFKSVPDGEWKITFSHPGYKPVTQTVVFSDGERAEILVVMDLLSSVVSA